MDAVDVSLENHQDKVGGVTGNQAPLQMRPVTQDISEYIVIVTAHILIQKTMLIYSVPEKTPGRRTVMNVLTEMVDVKTVVQIIKDHFPVVAIGKDTGRMAKIVKNLNVPSLKNQNTESCHAVTTVTKESATSNVNQDTLWMDPA